MNTLNIPRLIINTFIKNKRLKNVVHFLEYIQDTKNLQLFYNFISSQGFKYDTLKPTKVLFHGSSKPLAYIKPNISIGSDEKAEGESLVYATNNPNYAIFLASIDLKDATASVHVTKNNTSLFIDTAFINGSSKLKLGYINIISKDLFKKAKNSEYITDKEIKILFNFQVTPQDLTVPIQVQAN